MNQAKVKAFKSSITRLGLLEPVITNPQNELIAGYHRYHACLELGWETIPTITHDGDESLIKFAENAVRHELSTVDLVKEIDALCQDHDMTTVCEISGYSHKHVQNLLRLARNLHPILWAKFARGDGTLKYWLRIAALPKASQLSPIAHKRRKQIKSKREIQAEYNRSSGERRAALGWVLNENQ